MDSETPQSSRFYEFLAWVELNKRNLAIGAGVLVALCFGCFVYQWHSNEQEAAANRALSAIHSTPGSTAMLPEPKAHEYLKVAKDFPGTGAGERALLMGAADLYAQAKYQEAQAQFEEFLKKYSHSSIAPQAVYGVAACLDALNKVDEALAKYQDVIARYSSESVAGQAKLAIGRLHEAKNQPELALKTYDDLIKVNVVWSAEARALREALLQSHPNLVPTNAPTTGASNLLGRQSISIPLSALTNLVKPAATNSEK
ncbi:MAG: tetratricopeptide repeat protein [Verrucomicrobiota bacterium]